MLGHPLAGTWPSLRLKHSAIAWEWKQHPKTSLLKCKYKWTMIITSFTHNGRVSQQILALKYCFGRLAAGGDHATVCECNQMIPSWTLHLAG